jgi:hypothetical protein
VFSVRYALLSTKRFFIIKTERDCGIGCAYYGDSHVTATWILITAQQGLLGYDALHFGTEMPTFQRKILPPVLG